MIKPTVGRVVWFTPSIPPSPGFVHHDRLLPCAAMVTHVWGDRMVNLVVFDSNGAAFGETSVTLLQDDDAKPEYGRFCAWMPYQVGQAAKSQGALLGGGIPSARDLGLAPVSGGHGVGSLKGAG